MAGVGGGWGFVPDKICKLSWPALNKDFLVVPTESERIDE